MQQALSARVVSGSAGGAPGAQHRRQITELFRAHEPYLRRLANRLCRSTMDPDDLLQDVLERTVLHFDSLAASSDPRAWMARVMRNLFIDRWRKTVASPAGAELDGEAPAPAVEPRAWWEELDAGDVRARLGDLPVELRGPFELFAFDGCSYAEIAERLRIAKNTVGSRVLRARRRLRQAFMASYAMQAIA
jgi:RNA polymerase sigma-70 factor (ECF subfamily)